MKPPRARRRDQSLWNTAPKTLECKKVMAMEFDQADVDAMGRQAAKSKATQDKIIGAVISLIKESGFAAASSSQIAKRAGITWGAVQHHFGGRNTRGSAAPVSHKVSRVPQRKQVYHRNCQSACGEVRGRSLVPLSG